MPVEIVRGRADEDETVLPRIHAERRAVERPDARLTLVAGIGHAPHPAAIADDIAAIDRLALRANVT